MNFFLFLSSIFVLNANAFFPFPNSLLSKGIVNIDSTISNIDNKLLAASAIKNIDYSSKARSRWPLNELEI